jgi:hypothetical protein
MSKRPPQTSVKADLDLVKAFQELAWDNGTTPPQLLNSMIRAMIQYVEAEEELPTPFAFVPKREMEVFREWRATAGLSVAAVPTPKPVARPAKKSAKRGSRAI